MQTKLLKWDCMCVILCEITSESFVQIKCAVITQYELRRFNKIAWLRYSHKKVTHFPHFCMYIIRHQGRLWVSITKSYFWILSNFHTQYTVHQIWLKTPKTYNARNSQALIKWHRHTEKTQTHFILSLHTTPQTGHLNLQHHCLCSDSDVLCVCAPFLRPSVKFTQDCRTNMRQN